MPYLSEAKRRALLSPLGERPPPLPGIPRPMSKTEPAEFLDVSQRFLELEVREGRLRALKLGARALRFLPGDVQTWLTSKATREPASV